jgi:retinol dehydrogenase-13
MKHTAIVTGAYGAIGKAIAEGIARHGYRLFLAGRDPEKLQHTCSELISATSNPEIFPAVVDLSSNRQIREFAERWNQPLNLLVNNAATAPKRRVESEDGIEMQWAVNVLAYYRLTELLSPFFPDHSGARVVNVASYWAGGLDMRDPEFKTRHYDNDDAYRQAKQANRMLSVAHAEILKPRGITVNSCHPGDVNSKLSNAFGFGGHETPAQGAATPLFLALSEEVTNTSGCYFEHLRKATCSFSTDQTVNRKLFDLCKSYG